MKERNLERFRLPIADLFRVFIHYRQKEDQVVQEYNDAKRQLGSLCDLKGDHIISGLIDDLLAETELSIACLTISTPSRWLTAAQRVETSLERITAASVTTSPKVPVSRPYLAVLLSATKLHRW